MAAARKYRARTEEVVVQKHQILKVFGVSNAAMAEPKRTNRMNEIPRAGIPQAQIAKMMGKGMKNNTLMTISLDFNQVNIFTPFRVQI